MGVDERLVAIRDPGLRAKLVEEARDWEKSWMRPDWMYYLGDGVSPDHTLGSYNNLAAMAEAAGEHWAETLLRLSDQTDGRALFNHVGENQNLKALRDLFAGGVFFGVGDAGAHVGMVMDAGWATFVLSHWIREDGLFTMGEGIRRLTSGAARILGLKDRGALTPGMRADINVFDADTVAETHPYRVTDFPAGASRLTQGSIGYKATLVNGEIHVIDGELTEARRGKCCGTGSRSDAPGTVSMWLTLSTAIGSPDAERGLPAKSLDLTDSQPRGIVLVDSSSIGTVVRRNLESSGRTPS